ncbi:MAG: 6-carboxytetrahydropterin synthase [Ignavibacteriae bacterium]|nr:6-carboxytetrahydropterin synthase [Ignavibacteriota bacterium]
MDMDTVRIARLFHWEMGHRLPFHEGGCANIHGHSYRMWVEVAGQCDENGMLIDYGDLKLAVQPLVEPLDHAFLCYTGDSVMRDFLAFQGFKCALVPFQSTAENITRYFLDKIWEVIAKQPRITELTVRIHETENSYAEAKMSRSV